MKDILRPILELSVVLPGLLLAYFPVKSYLKQSPGKLAARILPLMAGLCIGGGSSAISCMLPLRLPWQGSHCLQLGYIPEHSKSPAGNPEQLH